MAFNKTTWNDDADPALTAAQLNRMEQGIADAQKNYDRKIRNNAGSNYTRNTAAYAAIDSANLRCTLNVARAGFVTLRLLGYLRVSAAAQVYFQPWMDGAAVTGGQQGGWVYAAQSANQDFAVSLAVPLGGIPLGTHTFEWAWYVSNAATATLFAAGVNDGVIVAAEEN